MLYDLAGLRKAEGHPDWFTPLTAGAAAEQDAQGDAGKVAARGGTVRSDARLAQTFARVARNATTKRG